MEMEDIFNPEYFSSALLHFADKKDSVGLDGLRLSELPDYFQLNPNWYRQLDGQITYTCGRVRQYQILGKNGKQRDIYNFNALDRFVQHLIGRALTEELDRFLSPNCFSYRTGKGLTEAVGQLKDFVEEGHEYLVEIDIKDYFETIPHQRLLDMLAPILDNVEVLALIKSFLKMEILDEERATVYIKRKGLITGASMSPVLSNFYLSECDRLLDLDHLAYIRYGDDYFFMAKSETEGEALYETLVKIFQAFGLSINTKKSGVFSAFRKRVLGYYFSKTQQGILVNRPSRNLSYYDTWTEKELGNLDYKYDIISDGILTQEHWNLLFHSETGKVHLPTQVVDYINVYSNVVIDAKIIQLLSSRGIRVNIMDKYGEKLASIEPARARFELDTVQKQLVVYSDQRLRVSVAREFEEAILHNMRSVLRYYRTRTSAQEIADAIGAISQDMKELATAETVDRLMLIEARSRQAYYGCVNALLDDEVFVYTGRTRRPPKDELNALMSFGNVFLYNYIANIIYRSPLDIRFGFIHSAKRRRENLNLDLADLFKPVIVERTIFSMINRHELDPDRHFERVCVDGHEGVYLSKEGKTLFLASLRRKLRSVVTVKGKKYRYHDLIRTEVYKLVHFFKDGEVYKPYKYHN